MPWHLPGVGVSCRVVARESTKAERWNFCQTYRIGNMNYLGLDCRSVCLIYSVFTTAECSLTYFHYNLVVRLCNWLLLSSNYSVIIPFSPQDNLSVIPIQIGLGYQDIRLFLFWNDVEYYLRSEVTLNLWIFLVLENLNTNPKAEILHLSLRGP